MSSLAKVCVIVLLIDMTTPAPLPQAKTKTQNSQNGILKLRKLKWFQKKIKYHYFSPIF